MTLFTSSSRASTHAAGRPTRVGIITMGVLLATVAATACSGSVSVGGGTIAQAELETQAATKLAETVDNGITPNISCPGGLDAEVGAKITCELTVDGEETTLPVYIEVTEVNDGVANFDVEVGQP